MAIAKKAPNPIDKHVGSRVRMRRMMLAMSQEKLGDALGLTFTQRGYWYKIVVSATLDSTVSLAQVATMNKDSTTTLGIFLKKAVEYNIELNDSQNGGFEIIGQDTQGTYTLNASFIKRSTGT